MTKKTNSRLVEAGAQVAKALGNPHRLRILELLAQRERSVEDLSRLSGIAFANCSQHLQHLRRVGLIESTRRGKQIIYSLINTDVVKLMSVIQKIADCNMHNIDQVKSDYIKEREAMDVITRKELIKRMKNAEIILIDVRPEDEFAVGHIPGALNIPTSQLQTQMKTLSGDKEIVAYCRGPYCIMSYDAVDELRQQGLKARRLEEGFPEWRAADLDVAHV